MDKDTTKSTISELHSVLKEPVFLSLLHETSLDEYVKKLRVYAFLQLMIVAQVNGITSLTRISKYVKDNSDLQIRLGFSSISTSQLSRKLSELPPALFEKVFHHLVMRVQAKMGNTPFTRDIGRLHVIDSSTMSMALSTYPWATFRRTKAGIKLHLRVVVSKDAISPDKAVMLPASHSDRSQMNELIEIDNQALYLFDRGYVDYKQFDQLCEKDVRFITRLKKNAQFEVLTEQAPDQENHIYYDQEVFLGKAQSGTQMLHTMRLIKTIDKEGNPVTIATNCFDLSAKEIGDLYRYRWKIETFFKWIKQHLHVTSFYSESVNGVFNQIWIALITYCLMMLMSQQTRFEGPLFEVKDTLKNVLFKPFSELIKSLFRKPSRTSKGRKKCRWEEEFTLLMAQVERGEVEHLHTLEYDPLFL